MKKAGVKEAGRIDLGGAVYFEAKYNFSEYIIVDIGHWIGTEPIEK
jgi:hypothetical protein